MVAASDNLTISDLRTSGDNIRESVGDVIFDITPTATPFLSKLRRITVGTPEHEWLRDSKDAPTAVNAHMDGALFGAATPGDNTVSPARLGNRLQIMLKHVAIPRRAEKARKYGRGSEMNYQVAKKMPALKTDVEAAFMGNNAATAEALPATTALTAGVSAWLATNTDFGATGADGILDNTTYGFPTTARVAGTGRALSEATLLTQIRNAWVAGGEDDKTVYVSPPIKDRINVWLYTSATARTATQFQDQGRSPSKSRGTTVVSSVDFMVTSFGTIEIVPNRNMPVTDVQILDVSMFEHIQFQAPFTTIMGKDGLRERKVLVMDCGLKSCDEAASAGVFDIDDTAMVA